ncbi:hypothetical protein ANMWB30_35810 [Arthrobacter sp. MWB30]|nr:hypothetical protein ANMWB30_35810 [Arthrobacter sp. MWB30]
MLRYSASQAAASGRTATRSAPSAAANLQSPSPSPALPSSTEGGRRRGGSSRTSLPTKTTSALSHPWTASVTLTAVRSVPPAAATTRFASSWRYGSAETRSTPEASRGSHDLFGSPSVAWLMDCRC